MSRGFLATLIGIVITVIGRIGPWRLPAWPAVAILEWFLANHAPSVMSGNIKALGLVALLLINVSFWGGLAWLALVSIAAARRRLGGGGVRIE